MLLRANSHLRGASGLRFELIRRLTVFLNEGVTPLVREFGSIGASGDLAPLAQIMGALSGWRPPSWSTTAARCRRLTALGRLGLPSAAARAQGRPGDDQRHRR